LEEEKRKEESFEMRDHEPSSTLSVKSSVGSQLRHLGFLGLSRDTLGGTAVATSTSPLVGNSNGSRCVFARVVIDLADDAVADWHALLGTAMALLDTLLVSNAAHSRWAAQRMAHGVIARRHALVLAAVAQTDLDEIQDDDLAWRTAAGCRRNAHSKQTFLHVGQFHCQQASSETACVC